ncbi:MAG TPA: CsbD family protein [Alphaproteobacteria bacterium]|nr:CsbD family protein [Alphaproteobacteria bacterium]
MNKDTIAGEWKQIKGDLQRQWGKLTDNTMDQINGDRTKLLGAIQESYGVAREDAEEQLRKWEKSRIA